MFNDNKKNVSFSFVSIKSLQDGKKKRLNTAQKKRFWPLKLSFLYKWIFHIIPLALFLFKTIFPKAGRKKTSMPKNGPHEQPRFLIKWELKKNIQQFQPIFYEDDIKKIYPNFPKYLFNIYTNLQVLKNTFGQLNTKESKNNKSIQCTIEYITQLLSQQDLLFLNSINADYFQTLAKESNYKQAEFQVQQKLNQWEQSIQNNSRETIVHYTSYFQRLLGLLYFDFQGFFRLFDPHFADNKDPQFHPVFGKQGLHWMIQLDYHLRLITFEVIPENVLIYWEQILEKIFQKEYPNLLKPANLNNLVREIAQLNQSQVIPSMVKLISQDFSYRHTTLKKPHPFLFENYVKYIFELKKSHFKGVFKNTYLEYIRIKVKKLFNISQLQELPENRFYNQKTSDFLKSKQVGTLVYVHVIPIFNVFDEKIYKPKIDKLIHIMLLNGHFIDKQTRSAFMETYHSLKQKNNKWQAFIHEIHESTFNTILNTNNSFSEADLLVNIATRKLNELEFTIQSHLFKIFELYKGIQKYIEQSIQDWNSDSPRFIINANHMAPSQSKTFFDSLTEANMRLIQFIDIIQSFPEMAYKSSDKPRTSVIE